MAEPRPRNNRAFVLHGKQDARFEERAVPRDEELGEFDVSIWPKQTGICGSDIHYVKHGAMGNFVLRTPMVLGHESSGVVVQCGRKVTHLKPGDKVALEPGEVCRRCDACKSGKYQLCPEMKFAATPPYDGTLSGYYRLPSDLAYKLPDNVDLEEGAMMEPLSVAVQAVAHIGRLQSSQNVVVFGAGPVGLLCMAVAKALGARRIIAVDIVSSRLDFAKSYAATDTFAPTDKQEGEDPVAYADRQAQELREKLHITQQGPDGIDLVLDATGAPPCIQTGILTVKDAGTFVQVGMGPSNVSIPMFAVVTRQLKVLGSWRYGPGAYDLAISLVARGSIQLKPLITHRYTFDEADKAYQTMVDAKGEDGKPPIKVLIAGVE